MQESKMAVKRREAKSKGEKESYKHLNAEFQRIARTDARVQPWWIQGIRRGDGVGEENLFI